MLRGFVNINKPPKMSSSDVVVKVRGILRRVTGEKHKTGHLGTLDPAATGVLPVAVGNATRLFDYMQNKVKTYIATFKFGVTTDTLDRDGNVVEIRDVNVSRDEIEGVLHEFVGEIDQIPPQYSAKSIGGRRAYDIAREGGTVELNPKKITVFSIDLLDNSSLFEVCSPEKLELSENEYAFKIVCGSGTYIRSIARDLACRLNTVGYMTSLRRIQTGCFDIANAVTLKEFEENPLHYIIPIEDALSELDVVNLDPSDGEKVLNGVRIACDYKPNKPFVVAVCGEVKGIGESADGLLKMRIRL